MANYKYAVQIVSPQPPKSAFAPGIYGKKSKRAAQNFSSRCNKIGGKSRVVFKKDAQPKWEPCI